MTSKSSIHSGQSSTPCFDVHKNAAAPMIAMLGHSELDTEVSDAGIETAESDDCRGVSKKDRDANSVLAAT